MQYAKVEQQERQEYVFEPEFSDAHCHLNLFPDPGSVVRSAISNGVGLMITAGGCMKDNLELNKLANGMNVFGVVGISPDFANFEGGETDKLARIVKGNHNIVGIGEIGLDYKDAKSSGEVEAQKAAFISQISIANELGLPIVVHSRGAMEDTLAILKEHCATRAMFHFFEGDAEHAKLAEKMNCLVSIPALESSRRRKVIKEIGIRHIVTETDSPAACSSPEEVVKAVEMVALSKGITMEEAASQTTENLREFFFI